MSESAPSPDPLLAEIRQRLEYVMGPAHLGVCRLCGREKEQGHASNPNYSCPYYLLESLLARLDQREQVIQTWRDWAQFVYLKGGPVVLNDHQLQGEVCAAHDGEMAGVQFDRREANARADAAEARCQTLEAHVERRMSLLLGVVPLDEKAEATVSHRLDELSQLAALLSAPSQEEP